MTANHGGLMEPSNRIRTYATAVSSVAFAITMCEAVSFSEKYMRMLFVSFLLLALPAAAQTLFPQDITFEWTNATQYEDGSLIAAGDLTNVRVECFRNNNTVAIINQSFAATGEGLPQTETLVGAIPQPGTYVCYAYSVLFDGTESAASNSASRKYTGRPKPPAVFGAP
jgi:hypothetical protein